MIRIVIRRESDRNRDHPSHLLDCSLARETPPASGEFITLIIHFFLINPGKGQADKQTDKNILTQPKHIFLWRR